MEADLSNPHLSHLKGTLGPPLKITTSRDFVWHVYEPYEGPVVLLVTLCHMAGVNGHLIRPTRA